MGRVGFLREYLIYVKRFSLNSRILILYGFISGISSGIVYLLLNLYLAEMGLSKENIALFSSLNSLAAGLTGIPVAIFLDKLPRKYPMILSAFVSAACFIILCFASNLYLLLTLGFLLGIASIIFSVLCPPFLMENSSSAERPYLFSAFYAQTWASGALGSFLGGFLPTLLAGIALGQGLVGQYRVTLLLSGALALLASFLLFYIRKQNAPRRINSLDSATKEIVYSVKHPVWKFFLLTVVVHLGAGLFMPFMNLYFSQIYAVSSSQIGIVFTLSSIFLLLGTLLTPLLARKFGKVSSSAICSLLTVPLLIGLGVTTNFCLASSFYILRTALMNMTSPLIDAFAMEVVPSNRRVTVITVTRSIPSLVWAAVAPIAGYLMEYHGFIYQFFLGSSFYFLYGLLLLLFFGKVEKGSHRQRLVGPVGHPPVDST